MKSLFSDLQFGLNWTVSHAACAFLEWLTLLFFSVTNVENSNEFGWNSGKELIWRVWRSDFWKSEITKDKRFRDEEPHVKFVKLFSLALNSCRLDDFCMRELVYVWLIMLKINLLSQLLTNPQWPTWCLMAKILIIGQLWANKESNKAVRNGLTNFVVCIEIFRS